MDQGLKALIIITCVAWGGMIVGLTFQKYFESQARIACYEAAKANANIKCDEAGNK